MSVVDIAQRLAALNATELRYLLGVLIEELETGGEHAALYVLQEWGFRDVESQE